MSTKIIIDPQQAAKSVFVDVTSSNPATLIGFGFVAAGDIIPIEICYDDLTEGVSVPTGKDGAVVVIDALNNPVTVYGPGRFKIKKGVTTDLIGVSVSREQG